MKERPITLDVADVRDILANRKTEFRTLVIPSQSTPKVAPLRMEPWLIDGEQETDDDGLPCWAGFHPDYPGDAKWFSCNYGKAGDQLWVQEEWKPIVMGSGGWSGYEYKATERYGSGFEAADTMAREASRITLKIIGVRVERLQSMGEIGAMREGCSLPHDSPRNFRRVFRARWDAANPEHLWQSNPWVWVLSFKRLA